MLLVLNTDLVLTSRKDARRFVLELCMDIFSSPDLRTNIRIHYIALLEFYAYDSYDSFVSLNYFFRAEWPPPR